MQVSGILLLTFLIMAIIAIISGSKGLAAVAVIFRGLTLIFLVLFFVTQVIGFIRRRPPL
jgi:uncharacterized membrane protein YtjA (UPF0391 family)